MANVRRNLRATAGAFVLREGQSAIAAPPVPKMKRTTERRKLYVPEEYEPASVGISEEVQLEISDPPKTDPSPPMSPPSASKRKSRKKKKS